MNEKLRKEMYVVTSTNAKTKKQLMHCFDSIHPSCIVNKEGIILFCNEGFENYIKKNFDIKGAPANIFKVVLDDNSVSKDKLLKAMLKVYTSGQKTGFIR